MLAGSPTSTAAPFQAGPKRAFLTGSQVVLTPGEALATHLFSQRPPESVLRSYQPPSIERPKHIPPLNSRLKTARACAS